MQKIVRFAVVFILAAGAASLLTSPVFRIYAAVSVVGTLLAIGIGISQSRYRF